MYSLGLSQNARSKWPLMSPAWGVFGLVSSLRCHPSVPFICFVIHFCNKQELDLHCVSDTNA